MFLVSFSSMTLCIARWQSSKGGKKVESGWDDNTVGEAAKTKSVPAPVITSKALISTALINGPDLVDNRQLEVIVAIDLALTIKRIDSSSPQSGPNNFCDNVVFYSSVEVHRCCVYDGDFFSIVAMVMGGKVCGWSRLTRLVGEAAQVEEKSCDNGLPAPAVVLFYHVTHLSFFGKYKYPSAAELVLLRPPVCKQKRWPRAITLRIILSLVTWLKFFAVGLYGCY